jgi:CheY-like chemotaxis protein
MPHARPARRHRRASKGRILVLDDDRLVLATVVHGLVQAGYEVIDADNGDDAILLAREHRPELALLDIRMEGKTGFDVAEYLRDVCRIPFMFLSAFSDEATAAKVAVAGCGGLPGQAAGRGQDRAHGRCRPGQACAPAWPPLPTHRSSGTGAGPGGAGCDAARPRRHGRRRGDAPLFTAARAGLAAHAAPGSGPGPVGRAAGRAAGAGGRGAGPQRPTGSAERQRLDSASVKKKAAPRPGSDSAQTSPPWRCTMRRTEASPTPVPGKSLALCRRWNRPNRRSATRMSKPAPLSRTANTRPAVGASSAAPNSMRACALRPLYFQALPSRFSSTSRSSVGSPRTRSPGSICTSTPRSGVARAQVVDDEAGQLRQVDRLPHQRLRGQPCHRQHGVDHLVHARAGGQHAVEVVVADAVELAAVVFLDDAREALDDADRRTQVMRHGVDQRRGLGVGAVAFGAQRQAQRCRLVAQQPPAARRAGFGQRGAQRGRCRRLDADQAGRWRRRRAQWRNPAALACASSRSPLWRSIPAGTAAGVGRQVAGQAAQSRRGGQGGCGHLARSAGVDRRRRGVRRAPHRLQNWPQPPPGRPR